MSGHSHWSTIRRQKQTEDSKRGKLFAKLSQAITLAVKEGKENADPATNARLRFAVEQAQQANMPKANIKRAIQRGIGAGEGSGFVRVAYGAFVPAKIVLFIEAVTDNRNRTTAQIKSILESRGARLASPEAVEPYFERVGIVTVAGNLSEEACLELALTAGADDFIMREEQVDFITRPRKLGAITAQLKSRGAGLKISGSNLSLKTKLPVALLDARQKRKLGEILQALQEHGDVLRVFTNVEKQSA